MERTSKDSVGLVVFQEIIKIFTKKIIAHAVGLMVDQTSTCIFEDSKDIIQAINGILGATKAQNLLSTPLPMLNNIAKIRGPRTVHQFRLSVNTGTIRVILIKIRME